MVQAAPKSCDNPRPRVRPLQRLADLGYELLIGESFGNAFGAARAEALRAAQKLERANSEVHDHSRHIIAFCAERAQRCDS